MLVQLQFSSSEGLVELELLATTQNVYNSLADTNSGIYEPTMIRMTAFGCPKSNKDEKENKQNKDDQKSKEVTSLGDNFRSRNKNEHDEQASMQTNKKYEKKRLRLGVHVQSVCPPVTGWCNKR